MEDPKFLPKQIYFTCFSWIHHVLSFPVCVLFLLQVNQSLKRVMNRAENSTITNVSRKKRTPFTDVSNMQNKRTKRENNKQGELWPKDQSTTQSIGTSETSNTSNTSNDEPTVCHFSSFSITHFYSFNLIGLSIVWCNYLGLGKSLTPMNLSLYCSEELQEA